MGEVKEAAAALRKAASEYGWECYRRGEGDLPSDVFETARLEQSARDFAAAEIAIRAEERCPGIRGDEDPVARWLRAGGLAQKREEIDE